MYKSMNNLVTELQCGTHRIHRRTCNHSPEPPKCGEILQMLVQNIAHMPLLISTYASMKYLHKVGENLIFYFLSSPLYSIVGFGCHIKLQFA